MSVLEIEWMGRAPQGEGWRWAYQCLESTPDGDRYVVEYVRTPTAPSDEIAAEEPHETD
jgi:hypothetical protein